MQCGFLLNFRNIWNAILYLPISYIKVNTVTLKNESSAYLIGIGMAIYYIIQDLNWFMLHFSLFSTFGRDMLHFHLYKPTDTMKHLSPISPVLCFHYVYLINKYLSFRGHASQTDRNLFVLINISHFIVFSE